MNTPDNETILKVEASHFRQMLAGAFITCRSSPDYPRYCVQLEFANLREAQEFHSALATNGDKITFTE